MSGYRLYFLDAAEHIFRSEEFHAFDDEGAEAFAQKYAGEGPVELWCRNRLIKRWSDRIPDPQPVANGSPIPRLA